MKPTPEQIARVEDIKEVLAGTIEGFYNGCCPKVEKCNPSIGCFSCFADSLLRTVFKDVPVGGELLQTGRAPEDTAYKAQHDVDSVTIGQVLEEKK